MGRHSLLQGIFLTQGLNPGLLQDSLLSEPPVRFFSSSCLSSHHSLLSSHHSLKKTYLLPSLPVCLFLLSTAFTLDETQHFYFLNWIIASPLASHFPIVLSSSPILLASARLFYWPQLAYFTGLTSCLMCYMYYLSWITAVFSVVSTFLFCI